MKTEVEETYFPRGQLVLHRQKWPEIVARLRPMLECLVRHEMRQASAPTLYIVGSSEMKVEFSGGLAGMTGPNLAECLRPVIGDAWRGICPAIVLNDRDMVSESLNDQQAFSEIAAIGIHEVTHLVGWYPEWAESCSHSDVVDTINHVATDPRQWPQFDQHPVWYGHDYRFVRLCLHAAWRFIQAQKIHLSIHRLLDWSHFGYSHPWEYLKSLESELTGLAHVPLSEIHNVEVPKPFYERWYSDVTHTVLGSNPL